MKEALSSAMLSRFISSCNYSQHREEALRLRTACTSVKKSGRSFDLFFASITCVADNISDCVGSSGHFREMVRE